jgi:hypothetical protein
MIGDHIIGSRETNRIMTRDTKQIQKTRINNGCPNIIGLDCVVRLNNTAMIILMEFMVFILERLCQTYANDRLANIIQFTNKMLCVGMYKMNKLGVRLKNIIAQYRQKIFGLDFGGEDGGI